MRIMDNKRKKEKRHSWNFKGKNAKSSTERGREFRARKQDIFNAIRDAIAGIDWNRRIWSQKSPRNFIRAYCCDDGGFLEYEPFKRTDEILEAMWTASDARVPYHIRMTRSGGKTSLMMCLCGKRIVNAESLFCVFTASKAKPQATDMIDDMWSFLENSPNLAQDYPEVCVPIQMLDGSAQKARSQKFIGRRTSIRKSETEIILPTIDIPKPPCMVANGKMPKLCRAVCKVAVENLCGKPSGGILLANGFDAKIRGLRKGKRRPDLILLDDLQDDDMAASAEQVEKAKKKIYKSYFKLGSQKRRPSILMTSTPIMPDDLSEQFANDPNWKTQTFRMMDEMPTADAIKLWKKYKDIKDTAEVGTHPETAFYRENRAAMDEGAKPFWDENFSEADGEISAIQHAMNAYLEDPESFESEYQMQPRRASSVYEISSRAVIGAMNGVNKKTVPRGFDRVYASVDVMSEVGLRWSVQAFAGDRRSAVIDFGTFPEDGKPLYRRKDSVDVKDKAVAKAVGLLLGVLASRVYIGEDGQVYRIRRIGIDAGWQTSIVHTEAEKTNRRAPVNDFVVLMKGSDWSHFSPYSRTGRLRPDVNRADEWAYSARGKFGDTLIFHSDHWTEVSQRSWLASPLQPDSLSIFDDEPSSVNQFAIECVADRLVMKSTLADGSSEVWKWAKTGANHWGDTTKMNYALAYWDRGYITASQESRKTLRRVEKKTAEANEIKVDKPAIHARLKPFCIV